MATFAEEKRDYIKANLPKAGLRKHCKKAGCRLNSIGKCRIYRYGGCPIARHGSEYARLKTNPFYARFVNKQMAEAAMREVVQDGLA